MGWRISSARESSGLYYFEDDSFVSGHVQVVVQNSSLSREQQIMLLLCRQGHPNFMRLKHLFLSLFRNKDFFQCYICQLAKHQHIFLPSKPCRASKRFALIHSNTWVPLVFKLCLISIGLFLLSTDFFQSSNFQIYFPNSQMTSGSIFGNFLHSPPNLSLLPQNPHASPSLFSPFALDTLPSNQSNLLTEENLSNSNSNSNFPSSSSPQNCPSSHTISFQFNSTTLSKFICPGS